MSRQNHDFRAEGMDNIISKSCNYLLSVVSVAKRINLQLWNQRLLVLSVVDRVSKLYEEGVDTHALWEKTN